MNNDHINNNELDAFSEKVKSKLENHQLPLDADLWDSIQQAVSTKKRRRMPVWLWIPMSAVAVIALILILRPIAQSPELLSHYTTDKIQNNKSFKTEKLLSENQSAIVATPVSKVRKFASVNYKKFVPTESEKSPSDSLSNSPLTQIIDSSSSVKFVALSTQPKDSIIHATQPVNSGSITQPINRANLTEKSSDMTVSNKIPKSNFQNQWLLAAAMSSGSNSSTGLENVPSATLSNDIVKAGTMYSSIMTPQSFTDVHYSLPLSFGLKIRNKFSETLSIETGVIYTYLQTDFSNSGFTTTDARLGLHYLGIPVSLNVKLWNNPKWEVYVSGGGTIEKGLRSIYQQTQNNTFQTWVTTAQTNIDGFQFSVNSAVGLAYKIFPRIGLFFEPQFSYYFENNQPISIRSKQPSVFSLQFGLRYNLNSSKP